MVERYIYIYIYILSIYLCVPPSLSAHDDRGQGHDDDHRRGWNSRRPPVPELVRAELLRNGTHVAVRLYLREVIEGIMPRHPVHIQEHADRELHLPGGAELIELAVLEVIGHRAEGADKGRRRPREADLARQSSHRHKYTHAHIAGQLHRHKH
jgi:hypothetical protein